jgi:hypothetical protein
MKKLAKLPDLEKLRDWKSIDKKGYQVLVKALKGEKKILVLATKNAGKNTVQNSIVNYIHRSQKETLVFPSVEKVDLGKIKSNKKLNEMKKICLTQKSYVAAIQYTGAVAVSEFISNFFGWFDLVLDLRKFKDQRLLCAIYEGKKLKCSYRHKLVKE